MQPSSKRTRDYRAEYQRRIERGIKKGLSRSQARGHPKAKEKNVRKPKPISDDSLQISLRALRSGKTLAQAAREIRVSPERLRNQAKALGAIKRKGNKWIVRTNLSRQMLVYSNGEEYSIIVSHMRHASKIGRYMSAVSKFLSEPDITYLKPFIDKTVTDKNGKTYVFETRPNALYRITASGGDTFEQIYRIIT